MDLLEYYADRTRKTASLAISRDAPWAFGVPRPVMDALRRTLKKISADPAAPVEAIVEELWNTGYREPQILAVELLSGRPGPEFRAQMEAWMPSCQDSAVLEALAVTGFSAWRRESPQAFLGKVKDWLEDPRRSFQLSALLALAGAVHDDHFTEIPALFHLIEGASIGASGSFRRVLYDLVAALAQRSPAETARFVMDEIDRDSQSGGRMARSLLHFFPRHERTLIQQTLSA
jgi:hypothetical protein